MENYDDIINLPHYEPKNHQRMSAYTRAAQFAPFAALTGYEDIIKETSRYTEDRIELNEEEKNLLDQKIQYLQEGRRKSQEIVIVYFKPDSKKNGGEYISVKGVFKQINKYKRIIILEDGIEIPINNVIEIEVV